MAYTQEMKDKLEKIVQEGKESVSTAIAEIAQEFQDRRDYIIKPEAIKYDINGELTALIGNEKTHFTQYSKGQLFSKIGMPPRLFDRLMEHEDMKDLAAMNIQRLTNKFVPDGLMFRNVNGTTKGVLSPSFGRFDASPLFHAFVDQAVKAGYVPMRGHNTTNRYQITFLLPDIREIAENEYLVFTITFTTSDYGAAANNIELGVLRVWCSNLAVGLNMLRKVHIGSRFTGSEDFMILSETTHNLDIKAVSSAIRDIVSRSVDIIPEFQNKLEIVAREDSTETHRMTKIIEKVRKEYGKEISESAKNLYDTAAIQELPKAPGLWRMSNVLSLMAQAQPADVRLDLQKEAFSILDIAA